MKSEKSNCKRLNSPYNISHFLLALPLNVATALCFCTSSETGHSGCDAYPETADGFSSWQKGGCGRTIDLCGKTMGMAAPKDPPENETFPSMLKGRKVESARIILAFPDTFYVQWSFWFNKGWSKLRIYFWVIFYIDSYYWECLQRKIKRDSGSEIIPDFWAEVGFTYSPYQFANVSTRAGALAMLTPPSTHAQPSAHALCSYVCLLHMRLALKTWQNKTSIRLGRWAWPIVITATDSPELDRTGWIPPLLLGTTSKVYGSIANIASHSLFL